MFIVIIVIIVMIVFPSRGRSTAAASGIRHLPTHLGHTPDGPAPWRRENSTEMNVIF